MLRRLYGLMHEKGRWARIWNSEIYEGWNFNNGNYLFTTDTK